MFKFACLLASCLLASCGTRPVHSPPPEKPQLWLWLHSQVTSPESLRTTIEQIDSAQAIGYTGIAFWDVSFTYLTSPEWPDPTGRYLKQAMEHAIARGMKTLAQGPPFGYSNDVLHADPNWAEALRVTGARFRVDALGRNLILQNSFTGLRNGGFEEGREDWFQTNDRGVDVDPGTSQSGMASGMIGGNTGNARFSQKLTVTPWRQYHVRIFVKTRNYAGPDFTVEAFDANSQKILRMYRQTRLAANQDWLQLDVTFNSQASTSLWLYFGLWGGSRGTLWVDNVQVEETALVYLVRRAGAPLRMYDPASGKVFQETVDFNELRDPKLTSNPRDSHHEPPAVTLPAGSALRPGQIVAMDYYAVQPVDSERLGVCLTDPAVQTWMQALARKVMDAIPPRTDMFLQYDEMRQMNSCASCRAMGKTAGQLLAWHTGQTLAMYRRLRPNTAFYVWSDMYDPYANARDHYYLVEGDIAGSWLGLPSEVAVMNWNMDHLRDSLQWFSGQNRKQPLAHRQIIAGYYDTHNGAAAAAAELKQASGIPGVDGLMYTTWENDYSQMDNFARAARQAWPAYRASLLR